MVWIISTKNESSSSMRNLVCLTFATHFQSKSKGRGLSTRKPPVETRIPQIWWANFCWKRTIPRAKEPWKTQLRIGSSPISRWFLLLRECNAYNQHVWIRTWSHENGHVYSWTLASWLNSLRPWILFSFKMLTTNPRWNYHIGWKLGNAATSFSLLKRFPCKCQC